MKESKADDGLPSNAVVFLIHQGYTFCYLLAAGGFDSPILNYCEGDTASKQSAASFEEFLQAEVALMESVNRQSLDQGGYFLSISRDGTVGQHYPAMSEGIRAVERGDAFLD